MRTILLSSWLLAMGLPLLADQQPAPAQPARPAQTAPAQPAPAQPAPAPAPRRPAAPAPTARTGFAIMVTDPQGKPLRDVDVSITGPSLRSGTTDGSGTLRVTGLMVGTYRLRFTGEEVTTFEREVTVRAGVTSDIDVTLNAAPPPPEPPPAPVEAAPPPAPAVGPIGKPAATSLLDYLSRNTIRANEPRREVVISCSGNTRSTLLQMNENQPQRLYDSADVTYYVIQGEGTLKVDVRETPIATGSFVSVPRGTGHEILRRGRRPLIMVAAVSGAPCEEAK